jgi:ribonuclease P protein component
MLPKINRLTKKKDFDAAFQNGKSKRVGFLILKKAKNNLLENRVGFIVSKKISNKATVRNKVKRRLRAIFFKNWDKLEKGYDFIVVTLPGIEKKEYIEIEKAVEQIIK